MASGVEFALKLNTYGQRVGTPFDVFVRLARQAEDVGFEGVYLVDHLLLPPERYSGYTWADPKRPYFLDCWTALAALAQATHRIRIGPQVSPLTFRHPALLAKMATTVDLISNGRLLLQLGTGWHKEEHEAYGLPYDEKFSNRLAALDEGCEVIRGLWNSEDHYSHDGRFFQIKDAPFWPKPVQQPHPPIWFGGMGGKVRPVIAKHGNGWAPAMPSHEGVGPASYKQGLDEIRSLARDLGRTDEITAGLLVTMAIAETREKAAELASVLMRRDDYAGLTLDDLAAKGLLLWGTPDDCRRALEPYIEAGVQHFTINFVPFADADAGMRGMELVASRIWTHL
jgi:probable F420-dependent oxidoreductase